LFLADAAEVVCLVGQVDSVVTDPPYGMGFQSNYYKGKHGRPNASGHSKIKGDLDASMLNLAVEIDAKHSRYIFCRWDNLKDFKAQPRSFIAWVKNNWSMGDLAHEHGRQYETIAFFPGENHKWPGKRPSDVVRHARTGNSMHPTEKPESLMREVISWTDGTVFDPFMGSGTTGVACANMGRRFIGVEIEEKYFQIACERIEFAYSQGRLFA
jgi:DNA modification methylase